MIVSLSSVKSAATGTAWKTAEMRGYVKKTVPDGAAPGAFNLDFVQADGDAYRFAWDGSKFTYSGYVAHGSSGALGTGSPVSGTALPFDAFLLGLAMGSASWEAGTADAYDAGRLDPDTVTGEW